MKTKMKERISIILVMVVFLITIIHFDVNAIEQNQIQEVEYQETFQEIQNPDRGFYNPRYITCLPEGTNKTYPISNPSKLVHFRLGLKAFSKKGNLHEDKPITEDLIQVLNFYMGQVRKAGGTAIIRFAYDNFEGKSNLEPDIDQIEEHIAQLKPFFEQNEDVITCVESGFLGPWGEQHSSSIVTNENMQRLANALLDAVPASRTINVRKPSWYCACVNTSLSNLQEQITKPGEKGYRIGIFNDGYLGSSSDLGTFQNREKEIAWISGQATHTFYGGEAVMVNSIQDRDEEGNLYHSAAHMQKEMFQTHTSYLNQEWNDQLIKEWKLTPYQGNDTNYNGKTSFEYIQNHLGYRLVLRKSTMPKEVKQAEKLSIKLQIENVGAGNIINAKDIYCILKKGDQQFVQKLDIDVTKWLSRESKEENIEVNLPESISVGDYEIYLKIVNQGENSNVTLRTIQFANQNTWDGSIGANRLGTIKVSEKSIIDNSTTDGNSTTEENNVINNSTTDGNSTIEDNNVINNSTMDGNSAIEENNVINNSTTDGNSTIGENNVINNTVPEGNNTTEQNNEINQENIGINQAKKLPSRLPKTGKDTTFFWIIGILFIVLEGSYLLKIKYKMK